MEKVNNGNVTEKSERKQHCSVHRLQEAEELDERYSRTPSYTAYNERQFWNHSLPSPCDPRHPIEHASSLLMLGLA